MQNLPVYLYANILDVTLDLDTTIKGVNQIMYQRDLTIQKGIKNQIRIQFKNSDQKRIHITNTQTYIFSMFDAVNQRTLIEKPLEILDDNTYANKGLALLTLTESDTLNLLKSSYQYSIKTLDTDGSYVPTYSNTYYGVSGTMHVAQDAMPALLPSKEISAFQKSFNAETSKYEHKSGNIYANPEYNGNSGLHTFAMYLTSYKGTIHIQGTLDNSPDSSGRYTTITSKTYNGFSGVDYFNINGIYSYVRILHIPASAPAESDNDNPAYWGRFDKFLYRS